MAPVLSNFAWVTPTICLLPSALTYLFLPYGELINNVLFENEIQMIAEYNKSLGEKLKSEIADREKTILQLRTSVEKLNEVQIKNTKEKLALCYELSELSQEKEKLNNILSIEVKKNMVLDDSKKEIAKTATSQVPT